MLFLFFRLFKFNTVFPGDSRLWIYYYCRSMPEAAHNINKESISTNVNVWSTIRTPICEIGLLNSWWAETFAVTNKTQFSCVNTKSYTKVLLESITHNRTMDNVGIYYTVCILTLLLTSNKKALTNIFLDRYLSTITLLRLYYTSLQQTY